MVSLLSIRKVTGIVRDLLFIISVVLMIVLLLTTITTVNQLVPIVQKAAGNASGLAGAAGLGGLTAGTGSGTVGSSTVGDVQQKLAQVDPQARQLLQEAFSAYQSGDSVGALAKLDAIKPIAQASGKNAAIQTIDSLKTAVQNNDLASINTLANQLLTDLAGQ